MKDYIEEIEDIEEFTIGFGEEKPIEEEEYLIYVDKKNMNLVKDSPYIFVDGMFSKVPEPFSQLYTFHILNGPYPLPVIFCLLRNNEKETYRKIFTEISKAVDVLNRSYILMGDFEITHFDFLGENVCIKCCHFHLEQILNRKSNSESDLVKYLACLAYAAPERVEILLSYLEGKYTTPAEKDLLSFFRKNYIEGLDLNYWNVSSIPYRTSNICETFHKLLEDSLPNKVTMLSFSSKLVNAVKNAEMKKNVITANYVTNLVKSANKTHNIMALALYNKRFTDEEYLNNLLKVSGKSPLPELMNVMNQCIKKKIGHNKKLDGEKTVRNRKKKETKYEKRKKACLPKKGGYQSKRIKNQARNNKK